ncbi:hypothetical protein C8F04DRAFT_1199250 [Mycena alexandri]|uniref:Uncharacterized protein n=1 Tax=Mycena alexandri TaxID=1745969 RepID=A0AAD6S0D5_9AGAR|nr:hypothetical protein C8F04DRAFT_1199250 [Mycena alexandri]
MFAEPNERAAFERWARRCRLNPWQDGGVGARRENPVNVGIAASTPRRCARQCRVNARQCRVTARQSTSMRAGVGIILLDLEPGAFNFGFGITEIGPLVSCLKAKSGTFVKNGQLVVIRTGNEPKQPRQFFLAITFGQMSNLRKIRPSRGSKNSSEGTPVDYYCIPAWSEMWWLKKWLPQTLIHFKPESTKFMPRRNFSQTLVRTSSPVWIELHVRFDHWPKAEPESGGQFVRFTFELIFEPATTSLDCRNVGLREVSTVGIVSSDSVAKSLRQIGNVSNREKISLGKLNGSQSELKSLSHEPEYTNTFFHYPTTFNGTNQPAKHGAEPEPQARISSGILR